MTTGETDKRCNAATEPESADDRAFEGAPDGKYSNIKTTRQSLVNKGKKTNQDRLNPTRYGDWEKAGRCIDF